MAARWATSRGPGLSACFTLTVPHSPESTAGASRLRGHYQLKLQAVPGVRGRGLLLAATSSALPALPLQTAWAPTSPGCRPSSPASPHCCSSWGACGVWLASAPETWRTMAAPAGSRWKGCPWTRLTGEQGPGAGGLAGPWRSAHTESSLDGIRRGLGSVTPLCGDCFPHLCIAVDL